MGKLWLRPRVWILLVFSLSLVGFLAGCGGKY